MAIAFRASATDAGSTEGALTVAKPTGTVEGDYMLAFTAAGVPDTPASGPAGWTEVRRDGTAPMIQTWSKLAGASEPANYTWLFAVGSTANRAAIACYTGVDATAVDVSAATVDQASATALVAPSVTTTRPADMLVCAYAINVVATHTPPAGMTERWDYNALGGARVAHMADLLLGAAGASGARTATASVAGTWTAVTVTLRAANIAPTAPTLTAPADNATVDLAAGSTFTWTFNDPDFGDTQGGWAFRRKRIGDADYYWWRASDSTWQPAEVVNTGAAASVAFPSGSWVNNNSYLWTVRTRDTLGPALSPYATERTVIGNTAPSAPTLTTPPNAAVENLAAGFTFAWVFNDPDGTSTQLAYWFRRKIGAGAYEYWRASDATWQVAEVENTTASASIAFAASKWTNGNVYNWSVKTKETGTLFISPYATDNTVTASTPPVVTVSAPTGVVTTTSRPTVTWSHTDAESDAQQQWQVKVFTAAVYGGAGFDPSTATPAYVSAVTTGTATSHALVSDLADDTTYRAYVRIRAGGQDSAWAFLGFSLNLTEPSAPTLTAVADNTLNRVTLTVTGTHVQATFPTTTFVVEYSDDAGTTWATVRNAGALPGSGTPGPTTQTVHDYEAPPNTARSYRARTVAQVPGAVSSPATATVAVTVTVVEWWLKDPLNSGLNTAIDVEWPHETTQAESQGVFHALGRKHPLVVADALHGDDGVLLVECWDQAAYDRFRALRASQRTLLLQSPFSQQWYIRFGAEVPTTFAFGATGAASVQHRKVKAPYVEVDGPNPTATGVAGEYGGGY